MPSPSLRPVGALPAARLGEDPHLASLPPSSVGAVSTAPERFEDQGPALGVVDVGVHVDHEPGGALEPIAHGVGGAGLGEFGGDLRPVAGGCAPAPYCRPPRPP